MLRVKVISCKINMFDLAQLMLYVSFSVFFCAKMSVVVPLLVVWSMEMMTSSASLKETTHSIVKSIISCVVAVIFVCLLFIIQWLKNKEHKLQHVYNLLRMLVTICERLNVYIQRLKSRDFVWYFIKPEKERFCGLCVFFGFNTCLAN